MKPRFFATPEEFRAWLEKRHARDSELLVGFWKRESGKPSMTWEQSVDVALCFGWIDAVRRRIDDRAYSIRFTRRKPSSTWSAINVRKVGELEAAGLMTDAGRSAFAARKAHKTAIYAYEREHTELTADEQKTFTRAAATYFAAQPAWYRRNATHWVTSAKRPETRARRLGQLVADCAAGLWLEHLRRR